MKDKLFAVYDGHLKDLSHRTEKAVVEKRQYMALISDELNVHKVIEKTKDSKGRPTEIIYETNLGFPGYRFLDGLD